jgi:hypothetical protein
MEKSLSCFQSTLQDRDCMEQRYWLLATPGSSLVGLRRWVIRYVDIDVSVERTSSTLTFDLQDGGNVPVRNIRIYLQVYTLS